jgi:nucleotide-binding universal stress UspA family protein
MKRILVPTDFSECAQSASAVALEIARKSGAHIFFLHISEDPEFPPNAKRKSSTPDPEISSAKSHLNELVLQATRNGVDATPILILNKGNERIENYVEPYGIDSIVMGSHGATGIREFVIGSHTQHVVKHATVPVLVIKRKPETLAFRDIVFASTFEKDVTVALGLMVDFARPWNAHLHLLYVNLMNRLVEENEAMGVLQTLTVKFPDTSFTTNVIQTNDAEWGIDGFAKQINADLIAVIHQDKESLLKVLTTSIAEGLVNHEQRPVLVLIFPAK